MQKVLSQYFNIPFKKDFLASTHVQTLHKKYIITALILLFILATTELILNQLFFHYPGNDYLPEGTLSGGISLIIIYTALKYTLPSYRYCIELTESVLLLYATFIAIGYLTNACQYTPFSPIDSKIIKLEHYFNISLTDTLVFIAKHPLLQKMLQFAYESLSYQMCLIPLLMAIFLKSEQIQTFCFFLLCTAIIGFSIYYFFPTTAPASMLDSALFMPDQQATGVKFFEMHQYNKPSTIAGGLISFPSFHVIWGWICLQLAKEWSLLYILLFPLNLFLMSACVLLGWHYPTDLVGSVIVLMLSTYVYRSLRDKLPPPSS